MKYNVGDKVRIKSIDWYNQMQSIPNKLVWQNKLTNDFVGIWCGSHIFEESMFEFLGKTMTIQVVGIDFYLMEEDTCGYEFNDEMIEGLVEEECPQDFIEKYCKSCGTQRCDRTKEYLNGCPYYNAYMCINQNNDMEEEAKPKPKFKVGDEVRIKATDIGGTIESVIRGQLIVNSKGSKIPVWPEDVVLMKSVEEETKPNIIEEAKTYWDSIKDAWICPEGYQFVDENGNVINATKIVLEKKKKEYPKTYEECCEIMDCAVHPYITANEPGIVSYYEDDLNRGVLSLRKLLICRDAYWKLYGEEMGLGKPWEPDWREKRYIIYRNQDDIIGGYREAGCVEHHIFEFPTPEMRNAFKENFGPDIEICKEFL